MAPKVGHRTGVWQGPGGSGFSRSGVTPRGAPGAVHPFGTGRPEGGQHRRSDVNVPGLDNGFVAGSSVFPTYGWANPLLTIIALALRLSDHLVAED
ncbi:MAG TPA: hypothetical protein DCY40_01865 [Actinobacteria bacterium]|nr:hypothetical protein [Actinomycetota bacterium]